MPRFLLFILVTSVSCLAGCGGQLVSGISPLRAPQRAEGTDGRLSEERVKKAGSQRRILQCGNPNDRIIALTFDDGPHRGFTEPLLEILRRYHVKSTFFIVGKMAHKFPDLLREEYAQGHLIANHTYDHARLTFEPSGIALSQYTRCNAIIRTLTGRTPTFCRPPGGDYDRRVVDLGVQAGLTTVLWTDDPGDYADPGEAVILKKAISRASNGGIILLHDGVPQTLRILPTLIEKLRSQGYRFVTVDELSTSKALAKRGGRKPHQPFG